MLGVILLLAPLAAQPVPVVLLNGYQSECPTPSAASRDTFGSLEQWLAETGRTVRFFDNCSVKSSDGRPPIEALGQAFGAFLQKEGLTKADVIAHSMGGLIVRSYLSGKQAGGRFQPPRSPAIRKAVFVATPHDGVLAQAGLYAGSSPDRQLVAMFQGSDFLWDLATWNQGREDLRGVDAISVVGDGGNGPAQSRVHDGTVSLISAAFMRVLGPERVRVVPYCHQDGLPSFLCRGPGIANVDRRTQALYGIVSSFLDDTDDWKQIGVGADGSPALSAFGGVHLRFRNRTNLPAALRRVSLQVGAIAGDLGQNAEGGFFADLLPKGQHTLLAETAGAPQSFSWTVQTGRYVPLLVKEGPAIESVGSADASQAELSLAAGTLVSLRGKQLDQVLHVTFEGIEAGIVAQSQSEIITVIPDELSGLIAVRVEGPEGIAETSILLESSREETAASRAAGVGYNRQ